MKKTICALVLCVLFVVSSGVCSFADVFDNFADGDNGFGNDGFGGDGFGGGYDSGNSGGDTYIFPESQRTDDNSSSDDTADGMIIAIIIFVVVIAASVAFAKGSQRRGGFSAAETDEPMVIAKIRVNDPGFSAEDFKTFVRDSFTAVQEAWESQDIATVSPIVSENLMRMLETYGADYKQKGYTNHLDFQNVRSLKLTEYTEDGKNGVVTVKCEASLIDYVTDSAGKTVRGNENERHERTYKLAFMRSLGVKTMVGGETVAKVCPSCGAPIKINATGRCEYCGCVINSGEFGWVMNEYGEWR